MAAPDNNKIEPMSSFPPLRKQVTTQNVQATVPSQNFNRQAIFAEDAAIADCHMATRQACPRSSGVLQKLSGSFHRSTVSCRRAVLPNSQPRSVSNFEYRISHSDFTQMTENTWNYSNSRSWMKVFKLKPNRHRRMILMFKFICLTRVTTHVG
jgi:hypothetical protein